MSVKKDPVCNWVLSHGSWVISNFELLATIFLLQAFADYTRFTSFLTFLHYKVMLNCKLNMRYMHNFNR